MDKITVLEHLKACAAASANYISATIAELAQTVAAAIEELDDAKQNKTSAVTVTIAADGWASDGDADYPCYYDIALDGVDTASRAEITIAPDSISAARACGMCTTNETLEGVVRVRSINIPSADISAECWIEDGKE